MKRNENPYNNNSKPQQNSGGYNNYNKKAKNEDGPTNFEEELMNMNQYEYIEGIENTEEFQEKRWQRPAHEFCSKLQDLGTVI